MPTKITCAGCNKTEDLRSSMKKVEHAMLGILGLLYNAYWSHVIDPDQRDAIYHSIMELSRQVEDINA